MSLVFVTVLLHFAICEATVFDDSRKLVIRGVMDKWESEGGGNPAGMVRQALLNIFHEHWSILIYDTFVAEKGCDTFFHYHNKWRVYGVYTKDTSYDKAKQKEFMNIEFGWANVTDIGKLQAATEKRVNEKFKGNWKVHVMKLGRGPLYTSFYGTLWHHNGYRCYIMRQS
jgi:hypothetical protein